MAAPRQGMKIVLQVGSELRLTNRGEVIMDNPDLELDGQDQGADAVLSYQFNEQTGEHVLRLLDPLADRKHMKTHRPND